MRREMSPTLLLAIAVALFIAPAIYILTASTLSHQGSLGGVTLPAAAQAVIWAAGAISLLAPLAIPRLLRTAESSTQLILILVVTVAASVFGLVLTFATGHLAPVQMLSLASMLAILGWAWVFRECFRAQPLEYVAPRYTIVLILLAVVSLAFAALRGALWDQADPSPTGPASSGFMIFIDAVVAAAALSTAQLRRLGSAYARPATQVLSWALLLIPLIGTLTALYWIFAVRKREQVAAAAPAA
jgi:hypothetical protein